MAFSMAVAAAWGGMDEILPKDTRIFIGSGVYKNGGQMKMGGFCFTYWEPEKLSFDEIIDLCVKEGVGNTLQFWQNDEQLLDLAMKAKSRGLYSTCIYSTATNGLARKITSSLGDFWIGYDFGERYSISLSRRRVHGPGSQPRRRPPRGGMGQGDGDIG